MSLNHANCILAGAAVIDFDGTIATTGACCKQGIDISYKGTWGYHPLLVTLPNTQEILYARNRPGNARSSQGFENEVRMSMDLVRLYCNSILLRGDTDFFRTKVVAGGRLRVRGQSPATSKSWPAPSRRTPGSASNAPSTRSTRPRRGLEEARRLPAPTPSAGHR